MSASQSAEITDMCHYNRQVWEFEDILLSLHKEYDLTKPKSEGGDISANSIGNKAVCVFSKE